MRVLLGAPMWLLFLVALLPHFFIISSFPSIRAAYARARVRLAVLLLFALLRYFAASACVTRLLWARVGERTPFALPCSFLAFEATFSLVAIASLPMPAPARVSLLLPMFPLSWGVWMPYTQTCFTAGPFSISPSAVRWALLAVASWVAVRHEAAAIRAWAAARARQAQQTKLE